MKFERIVLKLYQTCAQLFAEVKYDYIRAPNVTDYYKTARECMQIAIIP